MSDNDQADHGDETVMTDPTIQEQLALVAQLQAQLEDVLAKTEAVQAENAEASRHIAELEAALAKRSTGAKAAKALGRKVDPKLAVGDGEDDAGNAVSGAVVLLGAIAAADSVELVALDAKHREIAGFTQALSGGAGAFRVAGNGLRLALPEGLEVTAPAGGQSAIHAWGLMLDGKAAAFAKRFEPLVLGAGQRTNLGDDVIF